MSFKRPIDIKTLFEKLIEKKEFERIKNQRDYNSLWREVVGNDIADISKVEKIEKGVMVVKVESSAWRNELYIRQNEILSSLKKHFGEIKITQIIFR